tara:strand:- start:19 stop:384 length:366 start_codon:yes stop_codon:yes gene_type:complete
LKIKKTDISSIFPIIIKNIKLIFELVNKLAKFKSSILNNSELTVLDKVKIDNLKDFSKPILSSTRKLDKINRLKKKEIKMRKEIFTLSSVIFLSEEKIVLLNIALGLINFIISEEDIFKRI